MPRVGWLIGVVTLGIAAVATLLIVPERGPAEVDQPDAEFGGAPVSTTGTAIAAIEQIGGREDVSELIGRQFDLVVDIGQAVNDVAVWAGTPPDEILVVMNRGTRSGLERQLGLPSDTDFTPPPRGLVTVRGVIEPLPYAEAMYSWGLTRRDVAVVQERGVYLRVNQIVSVEPFVAPPLTAEEVDEFGRATAPPPGEPVETPLDPPPPLP